MIPQLKKFCILLGASCALIASLVACGAKPEWTVLVYVAADNNLEKFALGNLKQMATVGSTAKVNVVAQVDRGGHDRVNDDLLNLPNWGTTKRLFVDKGKLVDLADLGQVDMTDPEVLKGFIAWGKRTYPAKRYALVLWDHGAGWLGYATDDSGGKRAPMSLPVLSQVLKDSRLAFDLLGFDACLMASTEVALELHPYAKVLVASEELEPGLGWDYTAMLQALTDIPDMSGIALGKVVADGYLANLKNSNPRQSLYSTLSVIDLTQMPRVAKAFTSFVSQLNRYILVDTQNNSTERLARLGQVLGKARLETPDFGRLKFNDPGHSFDLGLLADNTAQFTKDDGIARTAADLKAALARAVVYTVAGDGFKNTKLSGLSLYLPAKSMAGGGADAYGKLQTTGETKWPEYLPAYGQAAAADKKPPVVATPKADSFLVIQGRAQVTITGAVTDETLVTGVVVGVVGILSEQQQVLVSFDEQPRTYRTINEYSYTFDGRGWYLHDGKGSQQVFSVQWRPGQRAVFGLYQQTPDSRPRPAYFIYDEASGELIEGFETVGSALGALLPDETSVLRPDLYTPELQQLETSYVPIRGTKLKKGPLPAGVYLITVTGFDLGENSAIASVIVAVAS